MDTIRNKWNTKSLTITQAKENDISEIQKVMDSCAYINELDPHFTEASQNAKIKYSKAQNSNINKTEAITLHTIKLNSNNKTIGFIECTYGFPDKTYFCISDLEFLKEYQKNGYGQEVINQLILEIDQINTYKHYFVCVGIRNWPSIRFWYKIGFNQIINFFGDNEYSKKSNATIVLEKQ